jgi:thermostable 8-oxoguanine DNA glycosylase
VVTLPFGWLFVVRYRVRKDQIKQSGCDSATISFSGVQIMGLQLPEELVYQTSYMSFWIKVFAHHVEFKSGSGIHSIPFNQIASIEPGRLGMMGVKLVTVTGEKHMIPTSKKKEVQQAMNDVKARFAENQVQTNVVDVTNIVDVRNDAKVRPIEHKQPQKNVADTRNTVPIDEYLARLKARRDTLQLELSGLNTRMSNIRARYQQSRSNFIFKESAYVKNSELKSLQPSKEKLQREILATKTEISRAQTLKKQGTTAMPNILYN